MAPELEEINLRKWLRSKIPKLTRRKLISQYVKHRYWYNQGNSSLGVVDDMVPVEKVTILIAGWEISVFP